MTASPFDGSGPDAGVVATRGPGGRVTWARAVVMTVAKMVDGAFRAVPIGTDNPVPVSIVGAAGGPDRELVVSTYRCKTAFAGAAVGDTLTAVRVLDVSGAVASQVGATIWRNESADTALVAAPAAANLEWVGATGLTNAQLRADPLVTRASGQVTIAATIALNGSLSSDIDCGEGMRPVRLVMPAAWTAADVTIQTSVTGASWNNFFDGYGTEVTLKVGPDRSVHLDPALFIGVRRFRIRSGTAGAAVAQIAQRDLVVVAQGV